MLLRPLAAVGLALVVGLAAWCTLSDGALRERGSQFSQLPRLGRTQSGVFSNWGPPGHASFDCDMKELAYSYGKRLIPRLGDFLPLYDALDLRPCGVQRPAVPAPGPAAPAAAPPADSVHGSEEV